jgi:hypothetical protein
MTDKSALEEYSAEDLLRELKRRSDAAEGKKALDDDFLIDEILDGIDSGTIHEAARDKQRVIYGTDDRLDLYEVERILANANSTVSLFKAHDIVENGDGTSSLQTTPFIERGGLPLCGDEPFRGQPLGAFCSGVLVAPDMIATAGHCVKESTLADVRFVFGFRMLNESEAQTTIDSGDIYRGVELLGWHLDNDGTDWALVRLDREVAGHGVASIRRAGKIPDGEDIYVIGHPVGMPAKYAPGAEVRDNTSGPFFIANLDTYGGNSGSPVFNKNTHEVEGLLVRGEQDFVRVGNCAASNVCPDSGCRGEDCTRATEFSDLVPDE